MQNGNTPISCKVVADLPGDGAAKSIMSRDNHRTPISSAAMQILQSVVQELDRAIPSVCLCLRVIECPF